MENALPIFDNHMHLSENGNYISAIHGFKKFGGTHLNYCPYTGINEIIKNKSYLSSFQKGLTIAKKAMEKTGVKIFLTFGPYPVDYVKLKKSKGAKYALELMKKGMQEAQNLYLDKKIIAIGEIGRPHFSVDDETLSESNQILEHGLMLAKDADAPVIIHMEKANSENMKELADMARKFGIKSEKVIKHYSPPLILNKENFGIFPSVIAKEEYILKAFSKGERFMLETDFLDDKNRPGAVLALQTIPRKLKKLLLNEKISEKQILKINKINPEKIYDITLE